MTLASSGFVIWKQPYSIALQDHCLRLQESLLPIRSHCLPNEVPRLPVLVEIQTQLPE